MSENEQQSNREKQRKALEIINSRFLASDGF